MPINIAGAVASYYRTIKPRGDEHLAHVSDLYGCDLATWGRRAGRPQLAPDDIMRTKWALGAAVEENVARIIEHAFGEEYVVDRNERVVIPSNDEDLVGHYDLFLQSRFNDDNRILIEVKSTSFLRGKPPTTASAHYIEQARAYAVALDCQEYCIIIVCRESGRMATFWFEVTGEDRAHVWQRVDEVVAATDPANDPPIPNPQYAWQCRYCPFAECLQNQNPAKVGRHG